MKQTYIWGNNSLAELLYYYLTSQGEIVDGFVLNERYVNENNYPLPNKLLPIEEVIIKHGPENINVYITVAYSKMNRTRQTIYQWLEEKQIDICSYIHPSCVIAKNTVIGRGNILLENVIIQPFVRIGNGNIIWNGSLVSHHCIIGDFNYLAPGVALSGRVGIEDRCFRNKLHCQERC